MIRPTRVIVISGAAVALTATAAGIGDVVVAHRAEAEVAKAAACRLKPSGPVTASLDGTLTGLRALDGDLGTVRVDARDVQRQGMSVRVQAEIHDVTSAGHTGGGTATVTVPYDQVGNRMAQNGAPQGLTPGTDGQGLVITGTIGAVGLPVTIHTALSVTADSVTVTPTDVAVLGRTVPASDLGDRLGPRTVQVTGLPAGVSLASIQAGAAGLELGVKVGPTVGPPRC